MNKKAVYIKVTMFGICSRIHGVSVNVEDVVIIVGVHRCFLVSFSSIKVGEHRLGLVQRHLGRGRPLERPRGRVLVAQDRVRARGPVGGRGRGRGRVGGHLGLEPVDGVLPLVGILDQPLSDHRTLGGGRDEALDGLVGPAAVRGLAGVDQVQEAVINHQRQSVILQWVTDALQQNKMNKLNS